MSIEDIEKIKDVEKAAKKIRRAADDEAVRIVAAGRREAKDMTDCAEREADAEYAKAIKSAETEADKMYLKRMELKSKECEAFKESVAARVDKAADLIAGKVVGTYGDS